MIKLLTQDSETNSHTYPKIMKGSEGSIIIVLTQPNNDGEADVFVIKRDGLEPYFRDKFRLIGGGEKFQDYNEPITIQND